MKYGCNQDTPILCLKYGNDNSTSVSWTSSISNKPNWDIGASVLINDGRVQNYWEADRGYVNQRQLKSNSMVIKN